MKTKAIKHLKIGIFTLLPIIVFIFILKWAISLILDISDLIFVIIPYDFTNPTTHTLYWYWHLAGILGFGVVIWMIGWTMNHYYIGQKITQIIQPIIKKTPILNTLSKISSQISQISQNKSVFEEVVFVEFPAPGMYYIGFITSENAKALDNILQKKVVSVFMPTTPNPTNGFLVAVAIEKITRTKIPVEKGFEYVISMGTLIDFETIEKTTTTPSVWEGVFLFL